MTTPIARTLVLLMLAAPALPAQEPHPDCATTPADAWQPRNLEGMPPVPSNGSTAVWTGDEMMVWGGSSGGRYNPISDSWTTMIIAGAPTARSGHTAVWTGTEMIIWGGWDGNGYLRSGGRYNPASDSWTAVTTTGAPASRSYHTAVWTGSEMIIWGGGDDVVRLNNGGRYNLLSNSWIPFKQTNALAARWSHSAVWTGSEMIVWGGTTHGAGGVYFDDGESYNPASNRWTTVSAGGAPSARSSHTAVWTGSEMIVWGGRFANIGWVNDGGRYDPIRNSWGAVSTSGAPAARSVHSAVWTGGEMLVRGGWSQQGGLFNDLFSYRPGCQTFPITSAALSGGNLTLTFPSVIGRSYTLWYSDTLAADTWTNTGLAALTGTGATLTFTTSATTPAKRFFRVQAAP